MSLFPTSESAPSAKWLAKGQTDAIAPRPTFEKSTFDKASEHLATRLVMLPRFGAPIRQMPIRCDAGRRALAVAPKQTLC